MRAAAALHAQEPGKAEDEEDERRLQAYLDSPVRQSNNEDDREAQPTGVIKDDWPAWAAFMDYMNEKKK